MKTQPDLCTMGIRKLYYVYMDLRLQEDVLLSEELFVKNSATMRDLRFS